MNVLGAKDLLRPLYKRARREVREIRAKTISSRVIQRPGEAFATHMPILIGLAGIFQSRNILELGGGTFSTPALLNEAYFPSVAAVHTVEDDLCWFKTLSEYCKDSDKSRISKVSSVSQYIEDIDLSPYDLIFIDDSKTVAERARTIESVLRLERPDTFVAVHDFEVRAYRRCAIKPWRAFDFNVWCPLTGCLTRLGDNNDKLENLRRLLKRHQSSSPTELDFWSSLLLREEGVSLL